MRKLMQSLAPTNSEETIALVGLIGLAIAVVSMLIWHFVYQFPLLAVPVIVGGTVAVGAMLKTRKATMNDEAELTQVGITTPTTLKGPSEQLPKVHACGAEKKAEPGSALWLVSVLCLFILILANILIP